MKKKATMLLTLILLTLTIAPATAHRPQGLINPLQEHFYAVVSVSVPATPWLVMADSVIQANVVYGNFVAFALMISRRSGGTEWMGIGYYRDYPSSDICLYAEWYIIGTYGETKIKNCNIGERYLFQIEKWDDYTFILNILQDTGTWWETVYSDDKTFTLRGIPDYCVQAESTYMYNSLNSYWFLARFWLDDESTWYYWGEHGSTVSTHQDYPYYVSMINSHEWTTGGYSLPPQRGGGGSGGLHYLR